MMEAVTTIETITISNKSAFFNLNIRNKRTNIETGINLINSGMNVSPLAFQKR